jgi:hypothetical protein
MKDLHIAVCLDRVDAYSDHVHELNTLYKNCHVHHAQLFCYLGILKMYTAAYLLSVIYVVLLHVIPAIKQQVFDNFQLLAGRLVVLLLAVVKPVVVQIAVVQIAVVQIAVVQIAVAQVAVVQLVVQLAVVQLAVVQLLTVV